jgi:hypothetical protein
LGFLVSGDRSYQQGFMGKVALRVALGLLKDA